MGIFVHPRYVQLGSTEHPGRDRSFHFQMEETLIVLTRMYIASFTFGVHCMKCVTYKMVHSYSLCLEKRWQHSEREADLGNCGFSYDQHLFRAQNMNHGHLTSLPVTQRI